MPYVILTVYIPYQVYKQLEELARCYGLSKSATASELITAALEGRPYDLTRIEKFKRKMRPP